MEFIEVQIRINALVFINCLKLHFYLSDFMN